MCNINITALEIFFFSLYDLFEDKQTYLCLYFFFFEDMTFEEIAKNVFEDRISVAEVQNIIQRHLKHNICQQ